MKQEFLAWAKKKKLLDENNTEVTDHMVQWLWLAWQTSYRVATANHKPTMDKLRMERDAYDAEIQKLLKQNHIFEAMSQAEESL
jgi:hypothetical protein